MKSIKLLKLLLILVLIHSVTGVYSQINSATMYRGAGVFPGSTGSYFGQSIQATGIFSFAGGLRASATGPYSLSLGLRTQSNNDHAYTLGVDVHATANRSFTFGSGDGSFSPLVNNIPNSLMVGFKSTVPTLFVGGSNGGASTGKVGIGTALPLQNFDVNGRIHVADGVIQRGGAAITNTSDLGLYSLDPTFWMRFVTNDAPFRFFSDGGANPIGGNALMSIEPNGNVGIGSLLPTKKLDVNGGNGIIRGIDNFLTSGNEAKLCLGDSHHFIKSEFNKGVTLGTFGVPNGLFLEQSTGNVGIGETTPIQKLDVNGKIHVADGVIQRGGAAITNTSDLGLYSLDPTFWMRFVTNDAPFKFFSDGGINSIGGNALMSIEPNGKVTIGTQNVPSIINSINTSTFKLFVKGGIATEEVVVATGWCDYVFEKDYELTPLKDVEAYIKKKGHLHNTPSGSEIESNGLELGGITVNQQEKIEELFLHLIDIDKRLKTLEAENAALKHATKTGKNNDQ